MARTLLEARQEGEARIGRKLTEPEYTEALEYSERKSDMTGHNRSYVLLLLPDVIVERETARQSAEQYRARKKAEKELEEWVKQYSQELARKPSDPWSFVCPVPGV